MKVCKTILRMYLHVYPAKLCKLFSKIIQSQNEKSITFTAQSMSEHIFIVLLKEKC